MRNRLALGLALGMALGAALGVRHLAAEVEPLFQFLSGDFSADVCDGTLPAADTGQTLTFTRATVASCQDATADIDPLTSGQPALEPGGIRLEVAKTSRAAPSDVISSGWTQEDLTLTASQGAAPDGSSNATLVTMGSGIGFYRFYQGMVNPGAGNVGMSMFAKAGTIDFVRLFGAGADMKVDLSDCTICSTSNGGGAALYNSWIRPAPNDWCEFGFGVEGTIGLGFYQVWADNDCNANYTATGGETLYVWRPNTHEIGSRFDSSSLAVAAASTTTRNAATLTATNPLVAADTSWSIRLRATPDFLSWSQRDLTQGLWSFGTVAAANSANARVNATGYLVVSVYDAAGNAKTFTSTSTIPPGSQDIRFVNANGTFTAYMGLTPILGAVTGTGTGIIGTMPTPIYFGSLGTASQINGTVRDVCVINTSTGCVSTEAATLATTDLGGGTRSNPLVGYDTDWCITEPDIAMGSNGEIMGGGTLSAANSWTVSRTSGITTFTVRDFQNVAKSRVTWDASSGTRDVRVCSQGGELFIDIDGVSQGANLGTSHGSGLIAIQPTALRISANACVTRDWTGCGGSKPTLVATIGDSLTYGPPGGDGNPTKSWPQLLDELLPSTYSVHNYSGSVSGIITTQNMTDQQWEDQIDHLRGWDVVTFMGGTNDIGGGSGETAAATWAIIEPLLDAIRARGIALILVLPTPVEDATALTWDATKQGHYDDLRTEYTDYCTAHSVQCVDLYATFENPGDADSLDAAYNIDFADGVHLNTAAMTLIAAGVHAAMGSP